MSSLCQTPSYKLQVRPKLLWTTSINNGGLQTEIEQNGMATNVPDPTSTIVTIQNGNCNDVLFQI